MSSTLLFFQVLLALSWMMAKAKVFPAFEQACLVSPLLPTPADPTPRQGESKSVSTPPPFPRDVSETPEVRRVSTEAFAAILGVEERRSVPPPDWGGRLGREEAVRMGEAETKGEGMARALGAAREMMCCYGGLEGELRVVEVRRARRRGGRCVNRSPCLESRFPFPTSLSDCPGVQCDHFCTRRHPV